MSNIKEILENEIYPAIFQSPDILLQEFGFKRVSASYYVSTTDIKITGERGEKGKVYYYSNNIGRLKDWTRGKAVSIWDYIQQREKLSNAETLKYLAQATGVRLPRAEYNETEYISYKRKAELWEELNSYLMSRLFTDEAKKVKDYLRKHRGYTDEIIQAMELGFMPEQDKMRKYLKGIGFTAEEISEIKLNSFIGTTHRLTIPLREPAGSIAGIVVRNINYKKGDKEGKYLNSTGLTKTDKLFNISPLKNKKRIVIVEGLLDCLHAKVKGIENVVALGGKILNIKQLETAIKYGAESIVLCLDNEPETEKDILNAIDLIKNNSEIRLYIAQLPDKIKDTDELINKQGAEAVTKAINEAIPYYEYLLQHRAREFYNLENPTALDEDEFIEDIKKTAGSITEPIDRDRYINIFLSDESVKSLGIDKRSLEEAAQRIREKADKSRQNKDFKNLLNEANELYAEGKTEEALNKIQHRTREIKQLSKSVTFNSLLTPLTETELRESIRATPESLATGYIIGGFGYDSKEELLLPTGAITIIAAPTSHCKTTMLINLLINTAKAGAGRQFHFFSYEENREMIMLKALNTFLEMELSINNLKSLKSYYSLPESDKYKYFGGTSSRAEFESKRNEFFKLVDSCRLNIHYVNYSSDTLIEAVEYLTKRNDVGAVYIDYMQLLRRANGKYNSRQEELKDICLNLKDLAVEQKIPIILGAQFNRQVINPSLIHTTNIGEAGDIERVANTIIGLWNNRFKPMGMSKPDEEYYKKCQISNSIYGKILKMREGKAGTELLWGFNGNEGKISNDISKPKS